MIDHTYINAVTCRRLGIPITVPHASAKPHKRRRGPAVDPTEFSGDVPPSTRQAEIDGMMAPVEYGNGAQATPIGVATFPFTCQGYCTKLTCPVLELSKSYDLVLGHQWCIAHKAIISYLHESITFLDKGNQYVLTFPESGA